MLLRKLPLPGSGSGLRLPQKFLFLLFLIYFGIPSYTRYIEKGVLVKMGKSPEKGLDLPTVTICPR